MSQKWDHELMDGGNVVKSSPIFTIKSSLFEKLLSNHAIHTNNPHANRTSRRDI